MADIESNRELQHLLTKPGQEGSGRVRYAAAMYFCQAGQLDQKTLEIYRSLINEDGADPLAVAKASGGGRDIEKLIERRS